MAGNLEDLMYLVKRVNRNKNHFSRKTIIMFKNNIKSYFKIFKYCFWQKAVLFLFRAKMINILKNSSFTLNTGSGNKTKKKDQIL